MVRLRKRYKLILLIVWFLFVLYPNPALLATTIFRSFNPPIDPVAVRSISAKLPDNPALIEQLVLTEYVPYAYDWTVYDVPWYFPTTREVVQNRRGDCKSRAVVLASILEDKQIPYEFSLSPIHIWVKYPGKTENAMESDAASFVEHKDGVYQFRLPKSVDLGRYLEVEVEAFWDPMPYTRKALLLGGAIVIILLDFLLSIAAVRLRHRSEPPVATEGSKTG